MCRSILFPHDQLLNEIDLLKGLPIKEEFYVKNSDCLITDQEYSDAELIFKHFNCKNMNEYSLVFLKASIFQLSEVILQSPFKIFDYVYCIQILWEAMQ